MERREVVEKYPPDANGGNVKIADEVVGVIAGIAATEVDGVAGMSGGIVGGITEILGKKNFSKGVKVEVGETQAAIDIFLVIDYGAKIPEIAQKVQENVKRAVESMTGLEVVEVNIHVQGVAFSDSKDEEVRVR
ncbi:MAG: Asp23/Gls24 family envelope stress response protein [Actinobacteria bacterium]|nr:Asp23/Gls24 family envelope stress response protein [Actinomycetota bacterium]